MNVVIVCCRHRFIRLHHFKIVRHAVGESIPRLSKGSFRQRLVANGNFDAGIRCGQVEPGHTHVISDAALKIGILGLAAGKVSLRLLDVGANASAGVNQAPNMFPEIE